MAYNTKLILRDASGAPVPQFYNAEVDSYQVIQGTSDGQIIQISKSIPEDTSSWSVSVAGAENASVIETVAAVPDKKHYIEAMQAIITSVATDSEVILRLIEDYGGANEKVLWLDVIGAGSKPGTSCGIVFTKPLPTTNPNMSITIKVSPGGGTGVYTVANMKGKTE